MTSILTAQPVTFLPNNLTAQMDSQQIPPASDRGANYNLKTDADDKTRGRRRIRNKIKDEIGDVSPEESDRDAEREAEGADGPSSGNDGPTRKRRRSRKGLDKKFECPQEGCGKSYSRAEHL
jgi:hypothetical protein